MRFRDRSEAGRRLAGQLSHLQAQDCVVLALTRGGVPVGYEIARALDAPLDVVVVRKLGTPGHAELAMGAVIDGQNPEVVTNPEVVEALGITDDAIEAAARRQLVEIERRQRLYRGERGRVPVEGKCAIVVDDGIATGASMKAALHGVRRWRPERLVLAVPVAPADSLANLRPEADEVVCLGEPAHFFAVGAYYEDFTQTTDDDVVALLEQAGRRAPIGNAGTG